MAPSIGEASLAEATSRECAFRSKAEFLNDAKVEVNKSELPLKNDMKKIRT